MRAWLLGGTGLFIAAALGSASGCSDSGGAGGSSSNGASSGTSHLNSKCMLPSTVIFQSTGKIVIPGPGADLSFLTLPAGFCAHYYATVPNARQLRVAPGGELFVASPTGGTTGGGPGGEAAIVVLADDNNDGFADDPTTFKGGLDETQGMLFTGGFFYYQDHTKIMRLPYVSGQRVAKGTPEQMIDVTVYSSSLHWPKALDVSKDGSIYVANGGDQDELCDESHPFHGGVLKIDGTPDGEEICQGLRNPIAIKCDPNHDNCFALELAKDFSADSGGREKMLPIRKGDDWGFPCCATKDMPYTESPPGTDCSTVTAEAVGFLIGDTPFGLAFTPKAWPGEWQNRAFVVTHGAYGSWEGARMISLKLDPVAGMPLPGSDTNGMDSGSITDFATGWADHTQNNGRPAAVEASDDGRLFVANDFNGVIFWIAPLDTD